MSSKSEAQLPRQLCSQGPLSSQKRTRENLGNKVDGKRLPCDLLGMVWVPKSHEVKGLDVVNDKFETGCVASKCK